MYKFFFKRVFDFIDFDYLEGLFQKDGVIDFIKKSSAEKLEESTDQLTANYNREQLRKAGNTIKSELKKAININNKQYDDAALIIKAFRGLIPYSRVMMSHDGYLIPLDDKYFRIDTYEFNEKLKKKLNKSGNSFIYSTAKITAK